mgnify:CR=1 FL=1
MEGFSVQKHVPPILKERPGERLTARQIAEIVFERHPAECEVKRQRSRAKVNPIVTDKDLNVLAEGPEQERMEAWIVNEVNNGAQLPGLYPMNADTKARYAASKK